MSAPTVEASLTPAGGLAIAAALKRLCAIEAGRQDIVSCYVRLEPADRMSGRYLTELKTRRAALDFATLPRERRLAVERDLDRIVALLDDPAELPHTRGMAVFACESLNLLVSMPLPRVHRNRLVVDDTPWLLELVAAERDLGRVFAVAVDRTHARMFRVSPPGSGGTSSADHRGDSGRQVSP